MVVLRFTMRRLYPLPEVDNTHLAFTIGAISSVLVGVETPAGRVEATKKVCAVVSWFQVGCVVYPVLASTGYTEQRYEARLFRCIQTEEGEH